MTFSKLGVAAGLTLLTAASVLAAVDLALESAFVLRVVVLLALAGSLAIWAGVVLSLRAMARNVERVRRDLGRTDERIKRVGERTGKGSPARLTPEIRKVIRAETSEIVRAVDARIIGLFELLQPSPTAAGEAPEGADREAS